MPGAFLDAAAFLAASLLVAAAFLAAAPFLAAAFVGNCWVADPPSSADSFSVDFARFRGSSRWTERFLVGRDRAVRPPGDDAVEPDRSIRSRITEPAADPVMCRRVMPVGRAWVIA